MTLPPLLTELPYFPDSTARFAPLANRPWAAFLDSGGTGQGRYDILTADPWAVVVSVGGRTQVRGLAGWHEGEDDPLALLRELLGEKADSGFLPFIGGALGYFGYDLGRRFEGLAVPPGELPEMALGIYDWACVVDHQQRRAWLAGQGRDPATALAWDELVALLSSPGPAPEETLRPTGPVRADMDAPTHAEAVRRILRYIHQGDCYQVNLARRFSVAVEGDPWSAYRRLRQINQAPFSAYLNTPFAQVLSASPERFLHLRDGRVETRPIKGTRPRRAEPEADRAERDNLQWSPKDRAENLMIVDLLRNDLGKSCAFGSVAVPTLFAVESFATVHHLVSTVTGELADGRDALDLLRGCFPGGSITGAPKHRAMEIIEELEPVRREIYCGAIGYIGYDGGMDTNIAIRTLVHRDGEMRFWAGGGIVADSDPAAEFEETLHKAAGMMRLFSEKVKGKG